MFRKPDELTRLETEILTEGLRLQDRGPWWGFMIAREMADQEGSDKLIGHGSLYKALLRLEKKGYLKAWWEDTAAIPQDEHRPRRRFYEVTSEGHEVLRQALPGTRHSALQRA